MIKYAYKDMFFSLNKKNNRQKKMKKSVEMAYERDDGRLQLAVK